MKNLLAKIALVIFMLCFRTGAEATWKPEYANAPQAVQDWYRNATLTDAAQRRFPFKGCCEKSEVVKTQFRVNKSTYGDEWYYLSGTTWKQVPPDIIHWNEHAPDGKPTLFVLGDGSETCFYPPDTGI